MFFPAHLNEEYIFPLEDMSEGKVHTIYFVKFSDMYLLQGRKW